MNIKNATELIVKELNRVYCDSCSKQHMPTNDERWNCDDCHRKSMMWAISESKAELIARTILSK